MSIARSFTAHLIGLNIEIITVEVDISNGLNHVGIVGLGDRAVEEAKDRISAAIKNSGHVSPKQKNQKVVISLAPADIRKEGSSFDLAMALTYLNASGEELPDFENVLILGELSLKGDVRKVPGVLPILCEAAKMGWKRAIIPEQNAEEASITCGIQVYTVDSLKNAIKVLKNLEKVRPLVLQHSLRFASHAKNFPDMSTVRGNEVAKRGLEIAAAGGHNVLMFGQPGTGKTMLAQSFPSILPPLSFEEAVEVTGIHSAAKVLTQSVIHDPPFRAPHHTASYPAVVGGGMFPRPGEITLAHRGVLFLDEFPEFDRSVLEALRQPLEDKKITVARARGTVTFPASCMLIASMNPCPCGKPRGNGCTCKAHIINNYRRRLSGPIMDRLDLWVNVSKIDYEKLSAQFSTSEKSKMIRSRVVDARDIQRHRFKKLGIEKSLNSEIAPEEIPKICLLRGAARRTLRIAAEKYAFSGRAIHRIMKMSRTIADLKGTDYIEESDVLESLQFRQKMDDV